MFFIPHPEGVLVGTTDLFHDGSLDDPRPTRGEVEYLLRTVAAAFPGRSLGEGDVAGSFAGVRPVIDQGGDDPTKASREEALWVEQGLLSIAGGKLTTWRSMAEKTVDRALRLLPKERARRASPCATAGTPLAGLAPPDLDRRLRAAHGIEPSVAEAMARRLGGMAWAACELVEAASDLRPLIDGVDLCAAEVRAHLRFGGVVRLTDLLLRRARLGMWEPVVAKHLVPRLQELVCAEMSWGARRWEREAELYDRAAEGWSPSGVRNPRKGAG